MKENLSSTLIYTSLLVGQLGANASGVCKHAVIAQSSNNHTDTHMMGKVVHSYWMT